MKNLLEHEVYRLFDKAGIKAPAWQFAKMGAVPKLEAGKTYVAKISSARILHKSDSGGVVFGVDAKNAEAAVKKLGAKFSDAEGILFAEAINHDKRLELLLGAYRDPFFGPLVTIGFGGTATDLLGKAMKPGLSKAVLSATSDKKEIESAIAKLPAILMATGGLRGFERQVGLEDVVSAVVKFQRLITQRVDGLVIEEIEANPVVCFKGGLMALDGVCRLVEDSKAAPPRPIQKIERLLAPKSALIAGASGKNPANPANVVLKNLLSAGVQKEKIFLIHPKEDSIEGIACLRTLSEVVAKNNGPVDLFVVGVPAKTAAQMVEEASSAGTAHSIQIISAGFGETAAGIELEKKLEAHICGLPEKIRPIVNGPNTLGNIYKGTRTLFTATSRSSGTGKGHRQAALICQSGAFMITAISNLANIINPTASISVGNQMDLTVADFLEFLLPNPEIKTFGLYIEGLSAGDGKRLCELSAKARGMGKFVVIYKVGRTKEGADAAKGHTASMAGDYGLFEELLGRGGAIIADTLPEFKNLLMLTALVKPIRKSGKGSFQVAALSNAGFEKCSIADHLMKNAEGKIRLAEYSPETIEKIKAVYQAHNISGIMDVHDILDLTPMMDAEGFEDIIRALLADPATDFGIFCAVPETLMLNIDVNDEKSYIRRIINIYKETKKSMCLSMESGWKYDGFVEHCIDNGIPCFRHSDQAARAVNKLLISKPF